MSKFQVIRGDGLTGSVNHRQAENERLIEKMRRGESFCIVPPAATWFPPRPIIKKNVADLAKIFGKDHDS